NVTGALGPAPGVNVDNSGDVGFGLLSVEYIGTAALDEFAVNITDSGAISIGGGFLNATNAGAINLDGNTSISATLTRVDASSDNVGIQVINNPGSFTVTGTGGVGTCGTITGMAVAGGLF